MNFGQALAALLNGKSITRNGWPRTGMKIGLQPPTGKITTPFLYVDHPHAGCEVYVPQQADILATDWEVADPPGALGAGGAEQHARELSPA
jgi:hypothetical protein